MRSDVRRGSVNQTLLVLIGSLVVLVAMIALLMRHAPSPSGTSVDNVENPGQALQLYCAASNKTVIESIVRRYQEEFGIPVQVQFGSSQSLLTSIRVSHTGDLFLPADESFITIARQQELVKEVLPLATMKAVVVVRKDNPLGIRSFEQLCAETVRLAQANPEAAAVGTLVKKHLTKLGLWERLNRNTEVYKGTVNEVANDVKVGAVDAGIVFDAVAKAYPELDAVQIPELEGIVAHVAVSVVASSEQPQRALHFARYIAASDRGLVEYSKNGFAIDTGDPWSERPEITLFAGAMLRPAIENTLTEFEQREGVTINRVYNGCGILVAQMKAGTIPDAYFACDLEFMKQVKDLFPDAENVSQNELVILVPEGNPQKITGLKDLSREGLRVGIGHEKQCAMGWLTQRTFEEGGVKQEVMKNVKVQTPTGDMLVNQLKTGSLDAAVAYLSNAAGSSDTLDAIRIVDLQCAVAVQPIGIAKDSPYHETVKRLKQALESHDSEKRFLSQGFRWGPAERDR